MKIPCANWSDEGVVGGGCALGLYGGHRISPGVCQVCIARGENNEEFAKGLFSRAETSHPPRIPRISGCCDRVDAPTVPAT